jgi:lysophospholipase L1-like esterase
MRILFLGDSITEGVGASSSETNYVSLVGKKTGHEVINYGVSGTRIARQKRVSASTKWDYDFRLRLTVMPDEADLVFIFGGTNDFGHGNLHLGKVGEMDENTFCGGLYLLLDALIEKYGKEKLCFLLPLHRFNEDPQACKGENADELGAPLSEYIECMRKILSEYGIEYIDLYENGFAKPLIDTGDEYTADGLHPNDNGYEFLANIVCDHLRTK